MTINTERLILQHFSGTDEEAGQMIRNWISDPLIQNEYGEPVYMTREELRPLLKRYKEDPYRWAVYEKESGECIGQIAFCKTWNDVHTTDTIERFRQEGIKPANEICYCITADEWKRRTFRPGINEGGDCFTFIRE